MTFLKLEGENTISGEKIVRTTNAVVRVTQYDQ